MHKENIPGLSIAVVDHGEVVWAQGFGYRDVAKRLPVDADTQFQAGSISKPVTAVGVLRLKESGQLDLDKDVNGYFKGWHLHSKWPDKPVTLRLLLCHRAGMVPHGFIGFRETRHPPSLSEVLSRHYFLNGPVKVRYPPGAEFRYSGGGYCVIQKVMEDVTSEPFEEVMRKTLLEPLQMNRSQFQQPPLEQETGNTARGYGWMKTVAYGGRWGVFPPKAAAGLWTTPQDLARFLVAVQRAKSGEAAGPISPATAEQFLEPQFDDSMGMGIFLDGEGDHRGFFHAGENLGYFAHFGAGVSNGHGWVIMTNAQKDRFDPIVKAVAQEFGWITPNKEAQEG
jgi:CubicO group peptidase (beta-lactamase class C family)